MTADADAPGAAGDMRYWAFLSYSHRDAAVAARLQQALETYRIPRSLIGQATPVGEPAPTYLQPIFRDRDDLQASPDLKARVRAALAQSRYLIVICSPDAARSDWVNDEIVEFKRLHGDQRVLALIVAGEPFASERAARADDECFPAALRFDEVMPDSTLRRGDEALPPGSTVRRRAAEPIAADLRPQGDGERLATLKLVAGMLGVGVDGLVRRDATRRNRRMAQVAFASFVGVIVMAGLTVMAVNARNEAQRQRAQAESLVEFMLTDLRKKLEPVGRLDILDALGGKALDYYASQRPDSLDASALSRRSRALHMIGDIREQRGQFDEALAAFQSASDTTAALLARSPHDETRIYDHAQSVFYVGALARERGDMAQAETQMLRYRDLADQLVALNPGNGKWQLETAYARQNLGVLQLEQRHLDAALDSFSREYETLQKLAMTESISPADLADVEGWIGRTHDALGNLGKAIDVQRARAERMRQLPDISKDRQAQYQVANAHYALAKLYLQQGNADTAQEEGLQASALAEAMVGADPENLTWLSEATLDQLLLAEIDIAKGSKTEAMRILQIAEERGRHLAFAEPTAIQWQVQLRGRTLALETAANGSSVDELEQYLARVHALEGQGRRLDSDWIRIVAMVELQLGDDLRRLGSARDAAVHWNASVSRLQPIVDSDNFPAMTLLALAYCRLGRHTEARAIADSVRRSEYRHPDYTALVTLLAHDKGIEQGSATAN